MMLLHGKVEVKHVADQFVEALRTIAERETQAAIARNAGLSESVISRILNGQRGGERRTIEALIRAYPELGRVFVSQNIP